MPDLTTLLAVKTLIDQTKASVATPNDPLYSALITSASAAFLTYTNRANILAQSFTETRNGDDSTSLHVKHAPLISVQSLTVNGQNVPAYTGFGAFGYAIDDNLFEIQLAPFHPSNPATFGGGSRFHRGFRNVVVSYTAGWNTVPADIAQAVGEMVLWKKAKLPRMDLSTQTLNGMETNSYRQSELPDSVKGIITNYTQNRLFLQR